MLVDAFLGDATDRRRRRRHGPPRRPAYEERAALVGWLRMLRAEGRVPARCLQGDPGIAAELAAFDRYLVDICGLQPSTRIVRRRDVRALLCACHLGGSRTLGNVRPAEVADFLARYTAGWKPASVRGAGISLRSYFRFKSLSGARTTALCAAIPRVALWRLSSVPPALSAAEIATLLAAFDRSTATGRRDYAIARCLADLGLRGAEVARLTIEEIDWVAGTLMIHGKSRRVDVLPLPRVTGQAIVAYLRNGRPQTIRREVFVRHRPPYERATTPGIVRNAVRYAAKRCGLTARVSGPHVLRHTLATRLVQHGARLKDVADLVRHRCIDTTTIYAKVDLPALAAVARPWPGSRP
ncbi:MAG: tyrosine-type recombinase/integrase [Burkholderiales bacterium]|nr:tyrosine-type recombinase/integrase [Burkholderiales bacterium]